MNTTETITWIPLSKQKPQPSEGHKGFYLVTLSDGHIDIDGSLPVNTHGGLLGEAYIHGVNSIQEGVRQVRGTAVNQVADVDHALVSSLNSGLVLGRP